MPLHAAFAVFAAALVWLHLTGTLGLLLAGSVAWSRLVLQLHTQPEAPLGLLVCAAFGVVFQQLIGSGQNVARAACQMSMAQGPSRYSTSAQGAVHKSTRTHAFPTTHNYTICREDFTFSKRPELGQHAHPTGGLGHGAGDVAGAQQAAGA